MSEPVLDRALLPAGCTVLCAVSGGADSVCLLDLVRRLGDVTVLCAHFDHGIRGAESARDAAFVEALCKEWGVPFFLGRGAVPAYAAENGLSVETAARELRYAFLERTAKEQGADVIATAHNLNDNAETILFRMARGTGLRGLAGIPARRGRIVRPLLQTPRRDIEEYLAAHNIPHVEDSTNAEPDAARNRVRRDVLPMLESVHPGAAAGIVRMSETLAEDEAFLASLAEERLARWGGAIPAKELCALPRPVARRALARWLGGELSRERFDALLRFAALPGGYTVPADAHDGDGLNYLAGHDFNEIAAIARAAVKAAHIEGGVPNLAIEVTDMAETGFAELVCFFELACGLSGYMEGVNPFDQPGVEAYKKLMFRGLAALK